MVEVQRDESVGTYGSRSEQHGMKPAVSPHLGPGAPGTNGVAAVSDHSVPFGGLHEARSDEVGRVTFLIDKIRVKFFLDLGLHETSAGLMTVLCVIPKSPFDRMMAVESQRDSQKWRDTRSA